jgi:hypothetical protein
VKNRNLNHKDDWGTPKEFYDKLDAEFNFDFDPCPLNHDITKWSGLEIEWKKVSYCNPPYSRYLKEAFVLKALLEVTKGKTVVMLLPVSTSTKLFHDYILPNATEIRFVKGRLKFSTLDQDGNIYTPKQSGMHDSMIVIFKPNDTTTKSHH